MTETPLHELLIAVEELRRVYGPSHPTAAAALERALSALPGHADDDGIVRLAALDIGVLCGPRLTPGAVREHSFLGRLRAAGLDRVSIDPRRATPDDLAWLVAFEPASHGAICARSPSGAAWAERLELGSSQRGPARAATSDATAHPGTEALAQLPALWSAAIAADPTVPSGVASVAARIVSGVCAAGDGMVHLLGLKTHDEYTFTHVINVALLSSALAQAAGLSGDNLLRLTEAALLHDVGKAHIPLDVLGKPGRLDDRERAVMQTHPAIGAGLLGGVRGLSDIAVVVAFEHHQRLDGKGYPRTLRPRPPAVTSQIVQIADIYDALRSERPYRAGMAPERCLSILADDAGRAFDRQLFELFVLRVLGRADAASPTDRAAA
jgi:HD-GYP domain-containing protein (c-di-GMP phosphodiesterase class II)